MKNLWVVPILFAASHAAAGGWEASRLDSGFIYKEGSYAELSYASLAYDIKATATNGSANIENKKISKAQTRMAGAFKMSYGEFDIGMTSYNSGAIQMQGGAGSLGTVADATYVPDGDAKLNSTSLIGRYSVSDTFSVLAGATQNSLQKSQIKTIMGTYDIKSKSEMGYIYGLTYEQPDIALRLELLLQPKSTIKANSAYTKSTNADTFATALSGGLITSVAPDPSFTTTLNRPEMLTLNFQSGIAADTLLYGFIHKASWKSAQINATTTTAGSSITSVSSDFSDSTAYSVGIARKISDILALTAAYTSEAGGGKTGTSLFTQTNGYQGISIGARYTVDKMTVSAGYSYNNVGDVTISSSSATQATYKNNAVSALGFKVGFAF